MDTAAPIGSGESYTILFNISITNGMVRLISQNVTAFSVFKVFGNNQHITAKAGS